MHRHTDQSLAWYTFDALPITHGVFTRLGGVSESVWSSLNLSRSTGDAQEPVVENRRRMMAAMHTQRWLTSWLVHGNHVRVVDERDLGHDDVHADAMITSARGMALTLRFADCIPVLFHDRRRDVIGIAHAGWKGVANGVLPATVRAMHDAFGCDPADIVAGIGPSIGPQKFEVGADVAAEIQRAVDEPVVIETLDAKPRVDLWRAARRQLHDAGVGVIETAAICTASDTHEWFSHRAEQGRTGRFGVVIEL
ncbi:MAG: peptidoglycan editing factor PgeF [Chloroflexi bacterium]|nr:peptidoglycan editing factor PgeF [Chloroflexota bacterium]